MVVVGVQRHFKVPLWSKPWIQTLTRDQAEQKHDDVYDVCVDHALESRI